MVRPLPGISLFCLFDFTFPDFLSSRTHVAPPPTPPVRVHTRARVRKSYNGSNVIDDVSFELSKSILWGFLAD